MAQINISKVSALTELAATQIQVSKISALVEIAVSEIRASKISALVELLPIATAGIFIYYNGEQLAAKSIKLEQSVTEIDTSVIALSAKIAGKYNWLAEMTIPFSTSIASINLATQDADNKFTIRLVDAYGEVIQANNKSFIGQMTIPNGIETAQWINLKIVGSGVLSATTTNYG